MLEIQVKYVSHLMMAKLEVEELI